MKTRGACSSTNAITSIGEIGSMSTGFRRPDKRTKPGRFDLITMSLAPLSTANFRSSLKISVWGVIGKSSDKKTLRIQYMRLLFSSRLQSANIHETPPYHRYDHGPHHTVRQAA